MANGQKKWSENAADPKGLMDAEWVTNALIERGWMLPSERNAVLSASRDSKQRYRHPFEVIAERSITNQRNPQKTLDLMTLTDWLAEQSRLPLFHIDPLKVDVHRVTQTMSYAFAERHQVLAVQVRQDEVVLATAQPFYR